MRPVLFLIFFITSFSAIAESLKFGELNIEVAGDVVITGGKQVEKAEVFTLASPSRLVVDVKGVKSAGSLNRKFKSGAIQGIRAASYPDKVRIVFDLSGTPPGKVGTDKISNGVRINIGAEPLATNPPPAKQKPEPTAPVRTVTPTPTPTVTPRPTATPTATPTIAPRITATPTPTELLPPTEPSDLSPSGSESGASVAEKIGSQVLLQGVYFKALETRPLPALLIDVDRRVVSDLREEDENKYYVRLENTRMSGPQLKLPQFAPDTFTGFEVVVCREEGADTVIDIYVEDKTKLEVSEVSGRLWVIATQKR